MISLNLKEYVLHKKCNKCGIRKEDIENKEALKTNQSQEKTRETSIVFLVEERARASQGMVEQQIQSKEVQK